MSEEVRAGEKTTLDRDAANSPGTETRARRHVLRTRWYVSAGLALFVVGVGILVPLGLLSREGSKPESDQIRPGAPTQTPPVTEESGAPTQTPPVTEESGSLDPEASADSPSPDPAGTVVEVATGTAFGEPWTLSAYWSGHSGERDLCLQLTGAGGGCGAPTDAGPYPDSTFHATYRSFSTAPSSTSFDYGVVSKDIRGVTVILDDGRVLSVETLRSKEFPVAFYVVAFKGQTHVAAVEALDAEGKVLDESSYRP